MAKKEATTTDKEKVILQSAKEKMVALVDSSEAKLKKQNKLEYIKAGIFGGAFSGLIVAAFVFDSPGSAILPAMLLPWLGIVTLLNVTINNQRHMLNVLIGQRDVEDEVLKSLKDLK